MSPVGGPPNGILVAQTNSRKKEKTNHDRLFGATKIPFEGPPMGTLRIREKIISIKMGCPVTVYKMSKNVSLILFSHIRAQFGHPLRPWRSPD